MPIPTPEPDEDMKEFINRCMGDEVMVTEYKNERQRMAVCAMQWSKK